MIPIQFGNITNKTVYRDGKEVVTEEIITIRELCRDDREELAKFLQFQKDAKHKVNAEFKREITGSGNRYVIRSWTN